MAIQILVKRGVLANRPALSSGEFYWATDTNQLFMGPAPTLINAASSGSVTKGTAIINFGTFPGSTDTSVAVTGQAGILSGSVVNAWLTPTATADHTADEHRLETIYVYSGNIVPGTGFTIYGVNEGSGFIYGQWTVNWMWA
jgi:hypothetical protein